MFTVGEPCHIIVHNDIVCYSTERLCYLLFNTFLQGSAAKAKKILFVCKSTVLKKSIYHHLHAKKKMSGWHVSLII